MTFQFKRTSFFVQIDLCSRLKIISVTYCSLRDSYRYAMFQGKVICFFVQNENFREPFLFSTSTEPTCMVHRLRYIGKVAFNITALSQPANYIEKKFMEYIVTSYHRGVGKKAIFFIRNIKSFKHVALASRRSEKQTGQKQKHTIVV